MSEWDFEITIASSKVATKNYTDSLAICYNPDTHSCSNRVGMEIQSVSPI